MGNGLGAEQSGGLGAGGVGGDRGGVGGRAESEGGVEGAEHHGFVGDGFLDEGGEGGESSIDGRAIDDPREFPINRGIGVIDGECGLANNVGIGVGEEFRNGRGVSATESEDDTEAGGG